MDTLEKPKSLMPPTPPKVVMPVQTAPSQHSPRARRFRVNAFHFSGNTVYPKQVLKRVLERYMDLELNLYDLNKAAEALTVFYHDHGYMLARAVIPPQKVVDGVVKIQIVEGRIGKTTFKGNHRYSDRFIAARTRSLTTGALVTTNNLETNLLLLNDLPGLSAKVLLEPGSEFGDTDAEIDLTEKLFSASVGVNNHGRSETGKNRIDLSASLNSPFGWGDQLTVGGSRTSAGLTRLGSVNYSIPVNTLGTRLSVGASKVTYDVDASKKADLGISGEVSSTNITVTHPLVRTRDETEIISVSIKKDQLKQNDELASIKSDHSINVINFSYLANTINADTSVTNARFSLTTNFKRVDDNITPYTVVDRTEYTQQNAVLARWEMDVNHNTPFSGSWDLYVRANLMYSSQMLPDTEKFSIGGPSSVRGYRPSELRGDSGYLATMELRRPFSLAGRYGIFRLTADSGEVTAKASGYGKNGAPFRDSSDRLHSAGFGATFYPTQNMVASFDVAQPIGKTTLNDGTEVPRSTKFWISVSANF